LEIAMVSEHASPLACLGGVDAGGQNVHVAALSIALAALGHRITVYTRADHPSLAGAVALAPGVSVVHVPAGPAAEVPKDELLPYMEPFAQVLTQLWQCIPPDLVHAHFWMSGMASLRAAESLALPVVQTFHALGTVKRRWQRTADGSPPDRVRIERDIVGAVDRVIATCSDEEIELRRMGTFGTPVDVIPCGVDTESFTPDPGAANLCAPSRPRLLLVGRLVRRKGVEDAIRAMVDIPDGELVIVGGPGVEMLPQDEEAQRLTELARSLGLADRIGFTGRVAHADLPALINSSDLVLVVPWYEPFGIVPLEAMACGIPVVGTAVGGLLDTVVDGVTGLLVQPGRPSEIAAAVNRLLLDPAARKQMGRAGRARAETGYSWKSVAARTEESYRRTLGRRNLAAVRPDIATAGAGR